jgi:hypothetical protein
VWVEGSIALGDFQPRVSDIDLFVVSTQSFTARERRPVRPWGGPRLQVTWSTWDALPALPTSNHGLGAVSAATLHRHGIAVRGPRPGDVVADVTHATLVGAMASNVEWYWRQWLARARTSLAGRLTTLHPRGIAWGVLGVPRQLVSVLEGTIVSKSQAGRYARARFEPRWHRIVDEALRLRLGEGAGRQYRSPFARRRDMLAFLDHAIDRTVAASRAHRQGSGRPTAPRSR